MLYGLDVGYSNLKKVFGAKDAGLSGATTQVAPAGAAPASRVLDMQDKRILVTHNDETWYAGVEPSSISKGGRELSYDYTQTDQFDVLVKAALMVPEVPEIEQLVTGLPVQQAFDGRTPDQLREKLTGEVPVAPKRTVKIKQLSIVPQPAAAYLRMLHHWADDRRIQALASGGNVVVVDPGFFSVDWVSVRRGNVDRDTSGTTVQGMAEVIKRAAELMIRDYGHVATLESDIELAVRNNEKEVVLSGELIQIAPYMKKAADEVAPQALSQMKADMRHAGESPADILLLVGGGGQYYLEAAKKIFPSCKNVLALPNPVSAIAEGYWLIAAQNAG